MTTPSFINVYLPVMDIKLFGVDNFSDWSCTLQDHLAGRGYWGHLDGSDPQPSTLPPTTVIVADSSSIVTPAESPTADAEWLKIDLRIKSYIISSVEIQHRQMIQAFSTTREIWLHLQKLFIHTGGVRRHHLLRLSSSAQQQNHSIQEFFTYLSGIWRDLETLEPQWPAEFLPLYIKYRDEMRVHQFLMSLRPDYEILAGQLIHRDPLPSLSSVLSELLAEETRQATLRNMTSTASPTALSAAVFNHPMHTSHQSDVSPLLALLGVCTARNVVIILVIARRRDVALLLLLA